MAASQQQLSCALQKYLDRVLRRAWRCRSSSSAMPPRHAVLGDCSFERTV